MQDPSQKKEIAPPSYTSCVIDNVDSVPISPGFDQFVRIVGDHERLHFHAPNRMSFSSVPEVVQIRDSSENPILSVMVGRMVVASGRNRTISSREIMTPSGTPLISISPGAAQTLSTGDQVLGMLEDDSLLCSQTLKAKNVIGDVIFEGVGNINMVGSDSCLRCCCGCYHPNSSEFVFSHRGVNLARLARSTNNSSGNELELFNSAGMDPRTKAILIYASYSAYLMFFVNTKCGASGDRGMARRILLFIVIGTLLIIALPLLFLL